MAARAGGRRSISRAPISTAARGSFSSAPSVCVRARSWISVTRSSGRRALSAPQSSSTTAPTSPLAGAPVSTSGRRISRPRRRGACSDPARRLLDAHRRADRSGAREPVSYLAVGPVFGTRTKDTGYSAVGLELVVDGGASGAGDPVVAIGGITLETAPRSGGRGRQRWRSSGICSLGGNPAAAYRQL